MSDSASSILSVTSGLEEGRTKQKLRTRNALVAAARQLIAQGASPTVEDAAAAASISRTTAYRYFRNQAELLAAAHPEIERRSLLPADAPWDAAARLDVVVRVITTKVVDTEAQLRTMLRLSLEPNTAREPLLLRRGRAIGWIQDALEPLRGQLSKAEFQRVVFAIRTTIGIEALVWLTDVAALSRDEAVKTMRWSAAALLRAALAEKETKKTARSPAPKSRSRR
jgi:AcrR family transcriptional regulator